MRIEAEGLLSAVVAESPRRVAWFAALRSDRSVADSRLFPLEPMPRITMVEYRAQPRRFDLASDADPSRAVAGCAIFAADAVPNAPAVEQAGKRGRR
jgi:hypothetical protein